MKIGIIAEDDSDVAVMKELTLALLKPHQVGFNKFVGGGCGKLRRKCGAWAHLLVNSGCNWIVVIHDLDENRELELRALLEQAVKPAQPAESVVLIPRRELEAWLLYDASAIAAVFGIHGTFRLPGNPESLVDPKRHLQNLVWKTCRKRYLNTIHNSQIAKKIRVQLLAASQSFSPHPPFVASVKKDLRQRAAQT